MVLKLIIFLGLLAAAHAGIEAPGGVSDIQHTQNDIGNYAFGYNIADPFGSTNGRSESGDEFGNKKGHYYLTDADGRSRRVDYVADEFGFRATVNTNEPGATNAFYGGGVPDVVVKTPAAVVAPVHAATKVVAPAYSAPVKIFRPASSTGIVAPTYSEHIHAPRVFAPSYSAHYGPAYAAHRYVAPVAPLLSHARYISPAAPLLSHTKVVAPDYASHLLSHTKVVAPAYAAPLLSHTKVPTPAYAAAPVLSHAKVVAPAYAAAPVLSHTKVVAPAYAAPIVPSYSTSSKTIFHHAAPAPAIVKVH